MNFIGVYIVESTVLKLGRVQGQVVLMMSLHAFNNTEAFDINMHVLPTKDAFALNLPQLDHTRSLKEI